MENNIVLHLLFLSVVIPASLGFQWTSSSQIPEGSSFRACVGERASFPWSFTLSTGEHVISVEWYRTTDKGQVIVAGLLAGHFFPAAGQNVTFVPGAGLQVGHVSVAEFGTYIVRVNYNNNGSLLSSQQTALLTMEDAPVLAEGQMVASICPEPVLDDVTGRLQVQLMCGHFLSLGSRPVSVVWKTPSDHTVASTAYVNGTFRLNLPHPTQGGGYYCHLKDPSVASRSCLTREAYIHVDEVQIRLTLVEGELQGLPAKDEKLDREIDRQADVDSELQSREQNLTSEVGRLAEITHMILTRTENLVSNNEILKTRTEELTSDNKKLKTQTEKLILDNEILKGKTEKLTSDDETLKTQTEKLTSDNEKLKTQTETLTSDNEILKAQTQKLMSDYEKLKTQTETLTSDNEKLTSDINGLKYQMQSMASQLTAETAKFSSHVDNMATNTTDIFTQLSALRTRSELDVSFYVGFWDPDSSKGYYVSVFKTAPVVFNYVVHNSGNGYNAKTGKFTAPYAGRYFFSLQFMSVDQGTVQLAISSSPADGSQTSYRCLAAVKISSRVELDQGFCTRLIPMAEGEQVYVTATRGDPVIYSGYTFFSGFLLFPE